MFQNEARQLQCSRHKAGAFHHQIPALVTPHPSGVQIETLQQFKHVVRISRGNEQAMTSLFQLPDDGAEE
jgi:hypothetical protein